MTAFRVLVTGSRTWHQPAAVERWLDWAHDLMLYTYDPNAQFVVVHGGAGRGAERAADSYARACNWTVEKAAASANLCLAFIRDHSAGATHCATAAEQAGIRVERLYDCACHDRRGRATGGAL